MANIARRGRPRASVNNCPEFSACSPLKRGGHRTGQTIISPDGLRASTEVRRTSIQITRPPSPEASASLVDDLSSWTPCDTMNIDNGTGTPPPDTAEEASSTGNKRKRYQSLDDPMGIWVPLMMKFMEEMLRRDGLGDHWQQPVCASCSQAFVAGVSPLFHCDDCFHELECLDCLLTRHHYMPLHRIQEWTGDYWADTNLRDLGYVLNIGHPKDTCAAQNTVRDMVVIHTNGIHHVKIRYCACRSINAISNIEQLLRYGWYPATITDPSTCATLEVLDLFRTLNVVASVNCESFLKTLSELSDPCNLLDIPDRFHAFARIERQYAFLLRVKRSGRPYRERFPGDAAVLCWACPHADKNLPKGWRNADEKDKFLYMLIVAFDANFRLKNRIRSKEHSYPTLDPGAAYFVEQNEYKTHLKNYVVEEDISTCVAFAALVERETKITTGLRTSGVAGAVCARHEVIRPLGLGDLQKGERYSNMDYVLLSSIRSTPLERVTISYDIACQWSKNLQTRIPHLPTSIHPHPELKFQFGIPTWHAAVHELNCRSENSLTYQDGVGRTDGEGIERTWSVLNDAAWSTKEMGEGARHDHLEDKCDHHNFRKNIGLCDTLARRLIIAREERDRQQANFEVTTASLKPEIRKEWESIIREWDGTRSGQNPYRLNGQYKNPTEAEVRAALKKEEAEEAATGATPIHSTTAAAFLAQGMRLEALQLKVKEVTSSSTLTLDAESKVHERRVAILAKIKPFRDLQHIYTPGAIRAIAKEEKARPSDAAPALAEDLKLWLPSDIPSSERTSGVARGLISAEVRLREAQCADALATVRRHLHSKHHLIAWRDANAVGQSMSTRSRTLIDSVSDKAKAGASKYRRAREALVALQGDEKTRHYPPLLDSDLTGDIVVEDDALAQRRLTMVTTKSKRKHVATGTRTLSWIWTASVGASDSQHGLDESVRVNWSKSHLRVRKWNEEVRLIQEEMRRVLRFLLHMKKLWKGYAGPVDSALSHGQRAYALRRSHLYSRIHDHFLTKWSSPFGRDRAFVVNPDDLHNLEASED